jgi:hypothetical protein
MYRNITIDAAPIKTDAECSRHVHSPTSSTTNVGGVEIRSTARSQKKVAPLIDDGGMMSIPARSGRSTSDPPQLFFLLLLLSNQVKKKEKRIRGRGLSLTGKKRNIFFGSMSCVFSGRVAALVGGLVF